MNEEILELFNKISRTFSQSFHEIKISNSIFKSKLTFSFFFSTLIRFIEHFFFFLKSKNKTKKNNFRLNNFQCETILPVRIDTNHTANPRIRCLSSSSWTRTILYRLFNLRVSPSVSPSWKEGWFVACARITSTNRTGSAVAPTSERDCALGARF